MKRLFVYLLVFYVFNVCLKAQETFFYEKETLCITKEFGKLDTQRVDFSFGSYYTLQFEEVANYSSIVGQAQLPQITFMVDLPICERFEVEETILEKKTMVLHNNIKIKPKQSSVFKHREDTSFYMDEDYYSLNKFDRNKYTTIEQIGIMGGISLCRITITPVRYNPQQNIIEYVNKISIKINFINIDEAKQTTIKNKMSRSFSEFLSASCIKSFPSKYQTASNNKPYSMVIVAPNEYENTLKDFVIWKKQQGFSITELYTNQIGNSTEDIKTYLSTLYNSDTNRCFDYLLICADVDKVPSFAIYSEENEQGLHYTDLYYADYTQDGIPDVFYGRISARDTLELKNILFKTISYESYSFEDDDFLDKALLVAGFENKYNAPKMLDGQNNYIKNYLSPIMDTSIYYHNQSLSLRNNILTELQEGRAWVNYTAHCNSIGWFKPTISAEDIHNLENNGKYGLFINNCCLAGKFDEQECFTEALLRQYNAGAVAAIGASDNTLWEEDYYWAVGFKSFNYNPYYMANNLGLYDRYFHTHNEPVCQQYVTTGQMLFAGWLAIMQSSSPYSLYYREIYNLQGDPSLMAYAGKGKKIISNYEKNIPVGQQSLTFNTQPNAYVSLTKDSDIIEVATADSNGRVCLDVSSISDVCELKIVISHQFFRPSIDTLYFVAPQDGFIAIKNLRLKNLNNNALTDHLEENTLYSLCFDITNIGQSVFVFDNNSIVAMFSDMKDEDVVLYDSILQLANLSQGESRHFENVFLFKTPQGLKDKRQIQFQLKINSANQTYNNRVFNFFAKAPKLDLNIEELVFDENKISVGIVLKNKGQLPSQEGNLFVENLNEVFAVAPMNVEETRNISFTVNRDVFGDTINFCLTYRAGNYFVTKILLFDSKRQVESFEEDTFLINIVNDTSYNWFVDKTTAFCGQNSFRSALNLPNRANSSFTLNLENVLLDSISFYVKVSSEENQDVFDFLIDDSLMLSLSGYVDWTYKSFLLNEGHHTLVFNYHKDKMVSVGEDAVWLDNISLPYQTYIGLQQEKTTFDTPIIIYPNPFTDVIKIEKMLPDTKVYIYDNLSNMVYFRTIKERYFELNLEFLKNGVYYIVFQNNETVYYKAKIVKTN